MESEVHSEVSQGGVSTSSTCSNEIHILQNEILEQTKQIEQFIASGDESDDTPAFVVLKSLFTLFKSELSVNLSLRKLLFEQKNSTESLSEQIRDFLIQIEGLGYDKVDDFNAILAIIRSQLKRLHHLKKAKKTSVDQARKNEDLATQLEALNIQEAENSILIASLNTHLRKATTENSTLRHQLNAAEKQTESFQGLLSSSEQTKHKLEGDFASRAKEIDTLQSRIRESETEKVSTISALQQKVGHYHDRVRELSERNTELVTAHAEELDRIQGEINIKIDEMKATRRKKVNRVVSELKARHQQEMHELKLSHQRDVEKLRQAHDTDLRDRAQKFETCAEEQSAEIRKLEAVVAELELQKKAGNEDDQLVKRKYHKLLRKIQSLKSELERIVPIHEREISKLRQEYDDHEQQLRVSLEASFAAELNKIKLAERELRFEVDEQQIENKRLREQLRQYSYILEQKDGILAKLQIELEANHARSTRRCSKRTNHEH
jgi:chromosome segregation ATPase